MESTLTLKVTLILGMMISGGFGTIFSKFQNSQYVYEGSHYKSFFHPYLQATMMFVAMFISLPIYIVYRSKNKQKYEQQQKSAIQKGLISKVPQYLLIIPALLDCLSSTLQYIALNFISASVYQMMKGGTIITTFLLSILFLKMKIQKVQILGTIMALVGILLVGASNVLFVQSNDQGKSEAKQLVGVLLIIASLFSNGFLFVYQQKLYQLYHIDPLYMVGMQGLFGIIIYIIVMPLLTFVHCSFGIDACVFSQSGQAYFQRPQQYFSQIFSSPFLFFCVIGTIITTCIFNITGNAITKYINALARSIVDISRTVFVWIFSIIITLSAGQNSPNYKWQTLKAAPIICQLVGFLILIFGNMIYNKIIHLRILNQLVSQNQDQTLNQQVSTEAQNQQISNHNQSQKPIDIKRQTFQ